MSIILSPGNYFGKEQQVSENASFRLNITAYQPDVQIREHYHENPYLSLLISGSYEEINKKADSAVMPGEVLFRPAGYSHANHFQEVGGRCLNIEFKPGGLQELELDHLLPRAAAIYKTGTFDYLYRLLYAFVQDPDSSLPEEHIISWLCEYTGDKLPERLPWLPKAKEILENEFDTHHTIQSLAARVFVHPVYLARAFKEREGITPGEYQLKMRVRKAMTLLFTTKLPVTDIAFAAGFSDASHLVKCFRMFYRATPHKFRALLKS
ncbi:helix-turn-helix domain-containing protein [Chitinophaga ginsengisegetis]|uniref:helix-turn-helix domain-containing protein n=1 Tax=Chitinophaga ginsengisegetis TaxID=393003 RepID=UPI000DBA2036|nr:helix-turn-helix domain-containing protein [Chitinophaga ginsengisegetis]MDR6570989.1 AraC-like DNA-binding protein [Chitinophaga ginsengisegetis]MDR6650723.1 AraC-like DNA-binding protein [Chitinophaga ginsengisegetis]MDR6657073.1 AraC-like DNA-binding protein [Chitinophaga ginsengisegetis]